MGRRKPSPEVASDLDERERRLQADHGWARRDPQIRRKYAGRVIAVRAREVVASAKTVAELKAVLEQGAYPLDQLVIVPIGV
jgi:hypothetical protein